MKVFNYISLLFICLVFLGCGVQSKENPLDSGIKIVTTTGMIADVVHNIVKDSANVIALMGSGVDPHLYKATQGDLKKLSEADLVFYNGLHLEGKMGEVLSKLGRTKSVVAVAEGLQQSRLRKVPEFDNNYDPHIWFDVQIWMEAVKYMRDQLKVAMPGSVAFLEENTDQYLQKLKELDSMVKARILEIPKESRVLITAHDAFGYFGNAYDIEVRGLQGISTLSEFGLKDVTDLVNFIADNKIKAVFVETSVSEKAIQAVVEGCRDKGHAVQIGGNLYSDAMGTTGTFEGTYVGMVTSNVNTIVSALK